jgi:paraquat-inducible protein B
MPEEKEMINIGSAIYPKRIYTKDEVNALIQKAKEEERSNIINTIKRRIIFLKKNLKEITNEDIRNQYYSRINELKELLLKC